MAGGRGSTLPGSLPLVWCVAGREPADTRGHKTDSLCGSPSSAAMGHAGLRRQSHHRDVLLRRPAWAIRREYAILLEDYFPDNRRRKLSLSDSLRQGLAPQGGK